MEGSVITIEQTEINDEIRVKLLDEIIAKLPECMTKKSYPEKACSNCYNSELTLKMIGMWWAERRCHYCEQFSNWSIVTGLRSELAARMEVAAAMSTEDTMCMNIKRDDYEIALLCAFNVGMAVGYGVDHENIHEDEEAAIKEYAESRGLQRKSLRSEQCT